MSRRRVVVTGLGLIAPVGLDVPTAWANIVAGKSGIQPMTHFDVSAFCVRFGGPIYGFDVEQYIPKKEAKKMDPFVHYGIAAGTQAIRDSGVEVTEENAGRIGVAIGSGIGGLGTIESSLASYLQTGPRRISPFFVPSSIINMVAGNLSIMFVMKGPNISIVSACSTGAHNIADAMRMIQYGTVDVMVAGGAEMATTALGIGGFAAARALSTRNDDPQAASRPWDKDRDGFVLSDGAGVVMVEELEHARRRGARIYCELAGIGWNSDAYHMTSPSPNGNRARDCMLQALRDAALASTTYAAPVSVGACATLKAIATAPGYTTSAVGTAAYVIGDTKPQAATPTFSPAAGTYTTTQLVTISTTTPGATIHFTSDGTDPTTSSAIYTSQVSMGSSGTLKAIATAPGYTTSAIGSATYVISTGGGSIDYTQLCQGSLTEAKDLIITCLHANPDWVNSVLRSGAFDCTTIAKETAAGRVDYDATQAAACAAALGTLTFFHKLIFLLTLNNIL